jgi:DNA-binding LacI/PurR family transcriptional regulator
MATIYDVARKANVSIASVSLVMNDSETRRVGKARRKQIMEAAETLGYTPSGMAKALSNGATRILGLVVPLQDSIFFNLFISEVLAGIQATLMEEGYHLMIYSHNASKGRITEGELTQSRFVDGVIVFNTRMCSRQDILQTIADLNRVKIPFVMTNCFSGNSNVNYVGVDDFEVGRKGAKFFAENGHREIALISGAAISPMTPQLLAGFKLGLSESKREFDPYLHLLSEYDPEVIQRTIVEWFSSPHPPTAIFSADDQLVPYIYKALERMKIHIPRDVAILGRGNLPISATLSPALTTIAVPAFEMGKRSAQLLISIIEKKTAELKQLTLESILIKRDSA